MDKVHHCEKEQFKKLFKQEDIDRFEDRYKILEIFLRTEKHLTSKELARLLRKEGVELDIEFIDETLKQMCKFGFAFENRFENGDISYEHRHLGQHHDHMICTKCRKIIEFHDETLEQLQHRIAADHHFHMLQHRMEIYGICPGCSRQRVDLMPISMGKPGERVIIKDFTSGATGRMRLLTMGLRIGDEVEVITNHSTGQMVIAVDYKRYVIGRGLAGKIMVSPVKNK